MDTPRVLKLSFEIRIPPGLKANVHGHRVEAAIAAFTGAAQGLAGSVFPWADRIVAEHSWSYEWFSGRKDVRLPATEKNTVAAPTG